ncbi:MAG: nucleoside hydrolase, partial [Planctomycetota bacterium]
MARKVIIDCDPGIDDAIGLIMALFDPRLEVVAVTTCSGTVEAAQAYQNVLALLDKLDPPRLPRLGLGLDPEDAPVNDGRLLHGQDGLGNIGLVRPQRQHLMNSDKLIIDRLKADPEEVSVLCMGPLTGVARAFQRDPSVIGLVDQLILLGGAPSGIGDVTAAAEFNMHFDPASAAHVLHSPTTKTLIPIDVTNQVTFDFNMLSQIPPKHSRAGELLHAMLPQLFRSYRQHRAQESIPLQGAIGVVYLTDPELFQCETHAMEIELLGSITRGATVVDRRPFAVVSRELEVADRVETEAVRDAVYNALKFAGQCTE